MINKGALKKNCTNSQAVGAIFFNALLINPRPNPCERGLRIDVRYVWTPQNGSF